MMHEPYTEWDGRVFNFTGEYAPVVLGNRRTARRNRLTIQRPVYKCEATGETLVLMPKTAEEMNFEMQKARALKTKQPRAACGDVGERSCGVDREGE